MCGRHPKISRADLDRLLSDPNFLVVPFDDVQVEELLGSEPDDKAPDFWCDMAAKLLPARSHQLISP